MVKIKLILCTLQFADDQVVLAGDKEDLEHMARKLTLILLTWRIE
jgi:hypothetical protein